MHFRGGVHFTSMFDECSLNTKKIESLYMPWTMTWPSRNGFNRSTLQKYESARETPTQKILLWKLNLFCPLPNRDRFDDARKSEEEGKKTYRLTNDGVLDFVGGWDIKDVAWNETIINTIKPTIQTTTCLLSKEIKKIIPFFSIFVHSHASNLIVSPLCYADGPIRKIYNINTTVHHRVFGHWVRSKFRIGS